MIFISDSEAPTVFVLVNGRTSFLKFKIWMDVEVFKADVLYDGHIIHGMACRIYSQTFYEILWLIKKGDVVMLHSINNTTLIGSLVMCCVDRITEFITELSETPDTLAWPEWREQDFTK